MWRTARIGGMSSVDDTTGVGSKPGVGGMTGVGDTVVQRDGRAKAYRPLPDDERRKAIDAGLAAYDRDDWFLAHELLEPAWMGTADVPERELLQGLIKLAAAHVHLARGNAAGYEKNLRGARDRVANGLAAGTNVGVDAEPLLAAIDAAFEREEGGPRTRVRTAIAIPRRGAG